MTVKEAAKTAIDHVKAIFGEEVADQPNGGDFRLEEIERFDDDSWNITVSFLRSKAIDPGRLFAGPRVLGLDVDREFKTVSLKPDGSVKSVTVRPITVSR